MVTKYKYRLVEKEGWRFELLPNNNNRQYVVKSSKYSTYEEAVAAIGRFKNFLVCNHNIEFILESIVCESKFGNSTKYRGVSRFSENDERLYTRKYEKRTQVKNGVKRVENNFLANIRTDL